MIPSDVANALRLQQPDLARLSAEQPQNQPVAAAQRLTDVLSDLVPGQRILAEIQALLPNGTYRAIVAQRDVTLALPFSAKPGDTLELEVAESDGKLTLAFVANRNEAATPKAPPESVSTSLSSTGKLIGNLLNEIGGEGRKAPPVTLNSSQPLVEAMPKTAADLAPVLKQAVTQSGMFYEAHQARWVAGELPTESLRQEPQGKVSPHFQNAAVDTDNGAKTISLPPGETSSTAPRAGQTAGEQPSTVGNRIPNELAPLVQQQLDGLSTQNFAWQGQIWPGQPMWWEIGHDQQRSGPSGEPQARLWQTRLKLTLPVLGHIEATLELGSGNEVGITLLASDATSEAQLRDNAKALTGQFEAAGLRLTQLSVKQNDQTGQ